MYIPVLNKVHKMVKDRGAKMQSMRYIMWGRVFFFVFSVRELRNPQSMYLYVYTMIEIKARLHSQVGFD